MKTIQRWRPSLAPQIIDHSPPVADVRRMAQAGLAQSQKSLPCSLFYDEAGAALFEQICLTPEYYPTRTEIGILRAHLEQIATEIGPRARLVELGSGGALKTRILLRAIAAAEYLPIDISRQQLLRTALVMARDYPGTRVRAVCADYTKPLQLPTAESDVARTVIFFPGSTIGNFEPSQAESFLRSLARLAGADGGLLIGVDLQKDRNRLEAAYNDAAGVTARFNINLLARLNREAGADFDLRAFAHKAIYDELHGRIEMHLVSRRQQTVRFAATDRAPETTVDFRAGETILTEHSYKYSLVGFRELAERAGWSVRRTWQDADQLFSMHWCVARRSL